MNQEIDSDTEPVLELTSKEGTFKDLIRQYSYERMGRDFKYNRAVHAKKRERRKKYITEMLKDKRG